MTEPPARPEARRRFGPESANELGAPVASSTPEQLPGHEPASARKGYEDGNALFRRHRCVEGSFGRYGIARGAILFGQQRSHRLGRGRTWHLPKQRERWRQILTDMTQAVSPNVREPWQKPSFVNFPSPGPARANQIPDVQVP